MHRTTFFTAALVGLVTASAHSADLPSSIPAPSQTVDKKLSQPALEALVSGVALYPDSIVQRILEAASHPVAVHHAAEAARASKPGPFANLLQENLPQSVQDLQQYPDVLQNLADHLPITTRLGVAYQVQPAEVWAAIASVRAKIESATATPPSDETADPPADGGGASSSAVATYPFVPPAAVVGRGLVTAAAVHELNERYDVVPSGATIEHSGQGTATGTGGGSYQGSTSIESSQGNVSTATSAGAGQVSTEVQTNQGQQTYTAGDGQVTTIPMGTSAAVRRTQADGDARFTRQHLDAANEALKSNWGHLSKQTQAFHANGGSAGATAHANSTRQSPQSNLSTGHHDASRHQGETNRTSVGKSSAGRGNVHGSRAGDGPTPGRRGRR